MHADDEIAALLMIDRAASGATNEMEFEARWRHADGSWRHTETVITNLMDDPSVGGLVLNTRDVTERKQLEEELTHSALHDPLTDLANRALFKESVDRALRRSGRNGRSVAVVFLDVDDFKNVNDSLGHEAGDRLLAAVAERIRLCVRPYDIAARLGGDEFGVLLENADMRVAASVAERILRGMDEPIKVDGREISTQGSLGIAVGGPGDDVEDVMRNADVAMYMAKGRGKGRYEVFEPGMNASAVERMELAADLRRAVEGRQFVLHYQPIVSLQDGGIDHVEALIRWCDPERGLVMPGDFIPVAEETGLIEAIGDWVIEDVCDQLLAWREQDLHPSVSFNVSPRQLRRGDLVARVGERLAAAGIEANRLVMEVTETAAMQDAPDRVERVLRELAEMGFRIAIDDFGSGWSSLARLRALPVQMLKIDRSFLKDVPDDPVGCAFVRAVVEFGTSVGLTTVAEGVETEAQREFLLGAGCGCGQGFHLGRPVPAAEAGRLISASG
jgi:diguanylate cyclase (GGDEF)-like protein